MRRGFLLSLIIHLGVMFLVWVNLPEIFVPEAQTKAIQVRLVAAKDVKKVADKKEIKKVRTQQSEAPRQAPKKVKKKKVEKPKHDTKVVSAKSLKKVQQQKPKPKKEEAKPQKQEEEKEKPISRPEKLDKTRNKKNVLKTDDDKADYAKNEDDFLKALSFVDDLEAKKNAMFEGEDTDPTTISLAEQSEIAMIKRHIERNWYKPPGIAGSYTVHVEIRLNRDGTLMGLRLVKSSGQTFFDNSLLRAVRKSVPLPIPSDKYDVFKIIDLHWNG